MFALVLAKVLIFSSLFGCIRCSLFYIQHFAVLINDLLYIGHTHTYSQLNMRTKKDRLLHTTQQSLCCKRDVPQIQILLYLNVLLPLSRMFPLLANREQGGSKLNAKKNPHTHILCQLCCKVGKRNEGLFKHKFLPKS